MNRKQAARRRKRQQRMFTLLLAVVAFLAVGAVLAVWSSLPSKDSTAASGDSPRLLAEPTSLAEEPTPLALDPAEPSQEPTAAPTQEAPTQPPAPTAQPYPVSTMLPIFDHSSTGEKVIAITVDDCFQPKNLRGILDVCAEYGAHITIFPIGNNLKDPLLGEQLRRAYEMGMELENHSLSHSRMYELTDEEMAAEIYQNQVLISRTLGIRYEMRFMRTRGGDNRNDPRTHAYIAKLGYQGMAHWNFCGTGSTYAQIQKALAPGAIYLFHTVDSDYENLRRFIPYAIDQGYRLVTLSELLGYPANETAPLPEEGSPYYDTIPPVPYSIQEYRMLRKGLYIRDVYYLQERLLELGYLEYDKPTGYYGDMTVSAVQAFQSKNGLQADGVAGPETQALLYSSQALPAG